MFAPGALRVPACRFHGAPVKKISFMTWSAMPSYCRSRRFCSARSRICLSGRSAKPASSRTAAANLATQCLLRVLRVESVTNMMRAKGCSHACAAAWRDAPHQACRAGASASPVSRRRTVVHQDAHGALQLAGRGHHAGCLAPPAFALCAGLLLCSTLLMHFSSIKPSQWCRSGSCRMQRCVTPAGCRPR